MHAVVVDESVLGDARAVAQAIADGLSDSSSGRGRSSPGSGRDRRDVGLLVVGGLLGRLGVHLVAPAEHFFVADVKGPLVEGEQERARRWGRSLADLLGVRA